MSIEIDILNGDASWRRAELLLRAVWSPDIMEKKQWADTKWAHADLRVLLDAPDDEASPVGDQVEGAQVDGAQVLGAQVFGAQVCVGVPGS